MSKKDRLAYYTSGALQEHYEMEHITMPYQCYRKGKMHIEIHYEHITYVEFMLFYDGLFITSQKILLDRTYNIMLDECREILASFHSIIRALKIGGYIRDDK